MSALPCEAAATDYPYVKLNYCTAGRCEVYLDTGKYVYLGPGMLSIDCNQPKEDFRYPSGRYEGLEIVLNMEELSRCPLGILEDLGIGESCREKLLNVYQGSYMATVSGEWDELARTLINGLKSGESRVEEIRFHVLQLLYFLGTGHAVPLKKNVYITKGQRKIAEDAAKKIMSCLKEDHTVDALAEASGVSPSSFKKYFVMVYGEPVSEYVRGKRMELAGRLLRETNRSVSDVAEEAGYAHQGKFGSAFKRYTGLTPLEYRRRYRERST